MRAGRTAVWLHTTSAVPAGTELRWDYDLGLPGHEFYERMLAEGISESELCDGGYRGIRWAEPQPRRRSRKGVFAYFDGVVSDNGEFMED